MKKPDLSKVITSWRDMAWQLRSYCVHDDDCTINRYPNKAACSCGLKARLAMFDDLPSQTVAIQPEPPMANK